MSIVTDTIKITLAPRRLFSDIEPAEMGSDDELSIASRSLADDQLANHIAVTAEKHNNNDAPDSPLPKRKLQMKKDLDPHCLTRFGSLRKGNLIGQTSDKKHMSSLGELVRVLR